MSEHSADVLLFIAVTVISVAFMFALLSTGQRPYHYVDPAVDIYNKQGVKDLWQR